MKKSRIIIIDEIINKLKIKLELDTKLNPSTSIEKGTLEELIKQWNKYKYEIDKLARKYDRGEITQFSSNRREI